MTQLELWNDTPEPWQLRMEADAFKLAFPQFERSRDDRVRLDWYYNHCQGGYCSTCAYHEESELELTVSWYGPPISIRDRGPGRSVGSRPLIATKMYERGDALKFWHQLMAGDSDGN